MCRHHCHRDGETVAVGFLALARACGMRAPSCLDEGRTRKPGMWEPGGEEEGFVQSSGC